MLIFQGVVDADGKSEPKISKHILLGVISRESKLGFCLVDASYNCIYRGEYNPIYIPTYV